jgi:photosystem II stability/assembly factor-like uncharacterized protein
MEEESNMKHLLLVGTKGGVHIAQRAADVPPESRDAWRSMGHSLAAHQVNSLSLLGGTVLAGTTEGVFRSEDLGQTWCLASEGLTEPYVRWLAHHPDGSGRVLAGTEPAVIFLSPDGGQTWAECPEVAALRDEHGWYLPYSPEAGCVRGFAFAFDGHRVYAAVEVGGVLRSDDGGVSWSLAPGSNGSPREQRAGFIHPDVHSVAAHPWSPDLVFAPTGGGLYRSQDGGQTWDLLYHCYCRAAWPDPAEAKHLILGPADTVDRNGRIERTYDGGETWEAAAAGLDVPWPRHMVERFLRVGQGLLAVLSNGELLSAPLLSLDWQPILPEAGWVRAVATTRV